MKKINRRNKKIQKYMLETLMSHPLKARYFMYDNDSVAVSWNDIQIYILPKDDICFALNKCKIILNIENLLNMTDEDKELTPAEIIMQDGKNFVQKLKADDLEVYVNGRYLKIFGKAKYYAAAQLGRVLAVESETEKIIGCVLPLKVASQK